MSDDQKVIRTHSADKCAGRPCVVHNPSDHPMRDFPLSFRMDRNALAERLCPHGVGRPDPDSLDYMAARMALDTEMFEEERGWLSVHGCCGYGCYRRDDGES